MHISYARKFSYIFKCLNFTGSEILPFVFIFSNNPITIFSHKFLFLVTIQLLILAISNVVKSLKSFTL